MTLLDEDVSMYVWIMTFAKGDLGRFYLWGRVVLLEDQREWKEKTGNRQYIVIQDIMHYPFTLGEIWKICSKDLRIMQYLIYRSARYNDSGTDNAI